MAPKSHGFINSCYANIDNKLKGQGEQFVLINQVDAMDRGIQEGEMIRVFNDRGSFDAVSQDNSRCK